MDSMLDTPVEAEGPSSQETQEEEVGAPATERTDENYIHQLLAKLCFKRGKVILYSLAELWDKGLQ